ncbi:hypothetical protein [Streptomyces sp. LaPpAH-108]|uniref:hypothetical protein n=1 Tax=Streptomyces sp. LaPpAH-108 TaxID=1155714 RepID=UPI0003799C95|nr:hypothetical protein [Streptomyces sp. LaPpAH-108]
MFAYDDYHRLRSAELRREAEQARLVREATRTARAARRTRRRGSGAGQDGAEAESHTGGPERRRFTPAA